MRSGKKPARASVLRRLRERALAYPGAEEHFPWGERVVKVKGKVFVFLGREDGPQAGISVKLPASFEAALSVPGCEPTGYGLGKARWVTATFPRARPPPLPLLLAWLDESYRAVAPRSLVAGLRGATERSQGGKKGPPRAGPRR